MSSIGSLMLATSSAVLSVVATGCAAAPPTNRALLASLPDEIEGVLLLDAEPLLSDANPLKREMGGLFGLRADEGPLADEPAQDVVSSTGANNLDRVVFAEVMKLVPVKRLIAGFGFHPPQGIGIGKFRYLTYWVTRRPNDSVRRAIEARAGVVGDVRKTHSNGLDVYQCAVEIRWAEPPGDGLATNETVSVAFPSAHVTVISLAEFDTARLSAGLRAAQPEIPARWAKAAAGIDVEAPLVVLRTFDQPVQHCVIMAGGDPNPVEVRDVAIDSFALAGAVPASVVAFRLRVIASRPDEAVAFFYGGTYHGGFPPRCWTWTRRDDAEEFLADVVFDAAKCSEHYAWGVVLTLLGTKLAI